MRWKQYLAGLCGFVFGFWMCIPRDVVLVPRYEVLVEDASGKRLPFVQVEQLRQDYAISRSKSFSFATADTYGRVAFPAVGGHTSPLRRVIVCARQKAAYGVHAPCGYQHQIVVVDAPGYAEASRTESALPLKTRGRFVRIMMRKTAPTP